MSAKDKEKEIDVEWVELMKEAKALGMTIKEIREFLRRQTIINK